AGTLGDRGRLRLPAIVALVIGASIVAALLVWQAVTAHGNPDPTVGRPSASMATLDVAILVFREGLECILVLTAITAGLMGATQSYRRPIASGAGIGFIATLVTWFIAIRIVDGLTGSISALSIQAWTGLLAILVLLVVMNWFFHKVYWTGWISFQNRRKRSLLRGAQDPGSSRSRLLLGLGLLGFASMYREGFEVVLFLQSYRLQMGDSIVFYGAALGLLLSGIVAVLNFVGHRRLPYKKMLILTGVMLAGVLFVMIGEQALEMQQAGWIPTTNIPWLQWIPDWAGTWFSIFPNWEAISAQIVGMVLVLGCYLLARYQAVVLPIKRGLSPFRLREAPAAEDAAPSSLIGAGMGGRL
ncbi:MAG: FTR1 family iron permease, partial [Chloroflexota bacterium]